MKRRNLVKILEEMVCWCVMAATMIGTRTRTPNNLSQFHAIMRLMSI